MTAAIQVSFSPDDERKWDKPNHREYQKISPPRYCHATPTAPWPWTDFNHNLVDMPQPTPMVHEPWGRYPRSHFGNWTPDRVHRCRMLTICKDDNECQVHKMDVFKDGTFDKQGDAQARRIPSDLSSARDFWDDLQKSLKNIRVRALFIENITTNVLQMLGARFNIEPSFFASSASWIPSRYQEDPRHGEGDHITVVLPFIRAVNNQREMDQTQYPLEKDHPWLDTKQPVDTQAPHILSGQKNLLQDLLAIHMVRNTKNNTIISYHHHPDLQKTTAQYLRSLVQRTGDSVYWSKLYAKSKDPTFVFLATLWYAQYAWGEALEVLHIHLNEQLDASNITISISYTRDLHKLQVYLLYYQQLLRDFRKSVEFVRDTPNPAMHDVSISESDREISKKLLVQESENLLAEIERLEKQRQMQSDRLQNAMTLAISTLNDADSRSMHNLTMVAMQNSTAIKLAEYLTMVFLPATFFSSVFGMNLELRNIKSLAPYLESTVILTLFTIWVMVALQDYSCFHPGGRHFIQRIAWPIFYGYMLLQRSLTAVKESLRRWHRLMHGP